MAVTLVVDVPLLLPSGKTWCVLRQRSAPVEIPEQGDGHVSWAFPVGIPHTDEVRDVTVRVRLDEVRAANTDAVAVTVAPILVQLGESEAAVVVVPAPIVNVENTIEAPRRTLELTRDRIGKLTGAVIEDAE